MSDQRPLSRRDLVRSAGLAACSAALASDVLAADSASIPSSGPDDRGTLSAYLADGNIWVRAGDGVFCCYRTGGRQKYPYLYPITGPATGLSLTDETALPWPHHRSLFLGCDRVNGANYWQEGPERGQIISRGPRIDSAGPEKVSFTDVCDWRSPQGQVVIEDERRCTISSRGPQARVIDFAIRLTARVDIRVEKTNHSFFSIRAARALTPDGGGRLLSSRGMQGEAQTMGRPAEWCGFSGRRCGHTESIVLMDHPSNPWPACKWFTRNYGFASPTPFFWLDDKGWTLAAGKMINVRYRVLAIAEEIQTRAVAAAYDEFKQS